MVASPRPHEGNKKRKGRKGRLSKVYAVALGRGGSCQIYKTLEEFKENIVGFAGGCGKSFSRLDEAQAWLNQFRPGDQPVSGGNLQPPLSGTVTPLEASEDMDFHEGGSPASTTPPMLQAIEDTSFSAISTTTTVLYNRMEGVEPLSTDFEPRSELVPNISPDVRPPLEEMDAVAALPPPQNLVERFSESLSAEQKRILQVAEEGKSLFFTGAAGTGKSVTLRAIIKMMRAKHKKPLAVAVTASTGIAALNIGGGTLHSFSGIGLGKKPLEELIIMVRRSKKALDRWQRVKTLIIDEISMIDGSFFDKLETIARDIREIEQPFGGIQLIICGDFFQLPPVPDQYLGAPVGVTFAFDAKTWHQCITAQMHLTKVFRQSDLSFVKILNQMRLGVVTPELLDAVYDLERDIESNGIEPVQIFPRKLQVESANKSRLAALDGKVSSYEASDCGRRLPREANDDFAHRARITELLDKYSIAPSSITLKEGAQVMLVRNVVPRWLVNGSLGRVIGITTAPEARALGILSVVDKLSESLGASAQKDAASSRELARLQDSKDDIPDRPWPVVEFTCGDKMLCSPLPFDMEDAFGDLEATRIQVPLILAWAITVHKSQGQTIERLKVDLDGTFEYGQAYVAMSRAVAMDTLQVSNFEPSTVRTHPRVIEWYKQLIAEEEMNDDDAVEAYFSHF